MCGPSRTTPPSPASLMLRWLAVVALRPLLAYAKLQVGVSLIPIHSLGNILMRPAAGSSLTVEMHQQPGDRSCSQPAIGGNHYGPVMVYMAKVSDAKSADGSQASFFKVAEDGYTGTTASWGTEILNANCGKRAFTGTISPRYSNALGIQGIHC